MRKKILLIIFYLFLFLHLISFSQEIYNYKIPPMIPGYGNIQVQPELMQPLKSIFPNVIFRYEYNLAEKGSGTGTLQGFVDDKNFELLKSFNSLLMHLYHSKEEIMKLNTESVIESYTYLLLLMGPYPYIRNNFERVFVSKEEYKYPKSDRPWIADSLQTFNYKIIIDLRCQDIDYWQQATLYYLIQDNFILSGYGSIKMNNGNLREFNLWVN